MVIVRRKRVAIHLFYIICNSLILKYFDLAGFFSELFGICLEVYSKGQFHSSVKWDILWPITLPTLVDQIYALFRTLLRVTD